MEFEIALAAVPMSIARPLVKNWNKNGLGPQVIHRFLPQDKKQKKNAYRIYLPIEPVHGKIVVPKPISAALLEKGYSVDDYITGIAVDKTGKRRMRIGKLIKDQELLKEFMNDPQRAAHKDDFTCVISCHPYDVLTMSTGRRWDETSCMRLDQPGKSRGGVNQHIVKKDIAEGTLVAYAISPEDTNINKPHARLLIKPFIGAKGAIFFRVETAVYGTPIPGFKETISRWLRQVNAKAASGVYELVEGLYNDGVGASHIHGNYDDVEDRHAFYKSVIALGTNTAQYHFAELFGEDKRWLADWIRSAVKTYITEFEAANQIHSLYSLMTTQNRITPTEFGKILDENMGEMIPYELMGTIASAANRDTMISVSERLTEEKETMVFDPDYGPTDDWVLEKVAYYDPRWLSLIEKELPAVKMANVCRAILMGTLKWTPEWQNSTLEGAATLRQIVGLFLRMIGKATNITTKHTTRAGVERLNSQFQNINTEFDAKGYAFMERMKRTLFSRFVEDDPAGLLCALDNSWPKFDVGLIVDAGRVIMQKEVFESIRALNELESDCALFNKTVDQKVALELGVSELFRKYPWTVSLVERIARGDDVPERLKKRAMGWLDDARSYNAEVDAIFAELEGWDDAN